MEKVIQDEQNLSQGLQGQDKLSLDGVVLNSKNIDVPVSRKKIVLVSAISVGLNFGWALQLLLLTPYVQQLGIPHKWASLIWLCGPVSGLFIPPLVGYYSDRCCSRWGRRRPFIAAGTVLVVVAIFLISFAVDLGFALGDPLGVSKTKPRAAVIFVVGFWVFDVGNNMCFLSSLLADLSSKRQEIMRFANLMNALFMGVGSILGYAAGSLNDIHKIFPFTTSKACDINCANLKSCFFISVTLLLTFTIIALTSIEEEVLQKEMSSTAVYGKKASPVAVLIAFAREIKVILKGLPRPMWFLLFMTALNMIAWFPFILYETDWMGREVYGGEAKVGQAYTRGIHASALGLMLQSVVLVISALCIEFVARKLGRLGKIWGVANIVLSICMVMTLVISKLAESSRKTDEAHGIHDSIPPSEIRISALALFAVLGIPLAVTFSFPSTLTSIFASHAGIGQGTTLGVLNIAVVIAQMLVTLVSGPWDAIFGGGNLPAFMVGAVAAAASGIFAFTLLPSPPPDIPTSIDSNNK